MWKLALIRISSRKCTSRNHRLKTIPRVRQRVQPHTECKLHRTCSQIFDVVYGAKQQRVVQAINSGKPAIHDEHRQSFLEFLSINSKRFFNKQCCRIQIKLPLLSASAPLPDDRCFPEPFQLAGSPPSQLRRRATICPVLLKNRLRRLNRCAGAGSASRRVHPGPCYRGRTHSKSPWNTRPAVHGCTRNLPQSATSQRSSRSRTLTARRCSSPA